MRTPDRASAKPSSAWSRSITARREPLGVRGPHVILVTGATGYVRGRLVPRLLAAGRRVRVLARDPSRLAGRAWLPRVEVAAGDVVDPATLGRVQLPLFLVWEQVLEIAGHVLEHVGVLAGGREFRQAAHERLAVLAAHLRAGLPLGGRDEPPQRAVGRWVVGQHQELLAWKRTRSSVQREPKRSLSLR